MAQKYVPICQHSHAGHSDECAEAIRWIHELLKTWSNMCMAFLNAGDDKKWSLLRLRHVVQGERVGATSRVLGAELFSSSVNSGDNCYNEVTFSSK